MPAGDYLCQGCKVFHTLHTETLLFIKIFLTADQTMPAGLIQMLLIRAGIESNPGPYICPVCNVKLHSNTTSVQCNFCSQWVHHRKQNNCSELRTTKDYNQSYKCRACLNDPLSSPTQPSQPVPTFFQH